MSCRSIVLDVRDSIGSFSRRSFDVKLSGHHRESSHCSFNESNEPNIVIQNSRWENLPLELLYDVIRRLEHSERAWPARKHVVACAAVCRSWRRVCKEIVRGPEICVKLTFPVSLKQPGPRDGNIQCFIKRDKFRSTYHLFLCSSPELLNENGKFLLSAKRRRRTTFTEYAISMNANNISRSGNTYIGMLRANFLGTKFIIYDTQTPHTSHIAAPGGSRRRFYTGKVTPKVPANSYNIARIAYRVNVLGTKGPRRMQCVMHSIPASSIDVGGTVLGQPELLLRSVEDSFRGSSFSKSLDYSTEFNSARFSDAGGLYNEIEEGKWKQPLTLQNN